MSPEIGSGNGFEKQSLMSPAQRKRCFYSRFLFRGILHLRERLNDFNARNASRSRAKLFDPIKNSAIMLTQSASEFPLAARPIPRC